MDEEDRALSVNAIGQGVSLVARIFSVLLCAVGMMMIVGGTTLLWFGGSAYYLLAGIGLVVAAFGYWSGRIEGAWALVATFTFTCAWALWEVGLEVWPLVPRIVAPAVLTLAGLLLAPGLAGGAGRAGVYRLGSAATAVVLAVFAFQMHQPQGVIAPAAGAARFVAQASADAPCDWTHYGRTEAGTRYAPFSQINRDNVDRLEVAWTYRSGDWKEGEDQNVPLQIGDTIYTCSRHNVVAALDADTGALRWKADPQASAPIWQRCRGLGYHSAVAAGAGTSAAPGAQAAPLPACTRRILQTTIDARLIALDAETGAKCAGFGNDGTVALGDGMGPYPPIAYFQTSAPLVAGDVVVVGGWVADNQSRGEPSGVVRAFDVTTGKLAWAWDLGNPANIRGPKPGETYTRGTPNMWSTASHDPGLGLVYLPLGNATPDYFGAGRTPESERYTAALVAVDAKTGVERWHYQTVHHDLWDYDLPSQPALVDLPDGRGGTIPALLQTTKRGQLFLLNRETGVPIAEVEERPVPQTGQVKGEWLAKTQPYSVGMPGIGTEMLSEKRMWGMTPLDQQLCRIRFRSLNYEGDFTPPSEKGTIQSPGNGGGLNWGRVAIDEVNGYAYLNDVRAPTIVTLMSQAAAKEIIAGMKVKPDGHGPAPQEGTPYGVDVTMFMSPLGVPCVEPPYGTMSAVDLRSRTIAWQVPLGTVEDTGPLGIATRLKMPVGMPTIGGSVATASGLVFFAGSQDFYLRALDAATGAELWKSRLPVGSGSSPMTYVSPKSGRQYVLISAGGARYSPRRGDYVIAYALPERQKVVQ